MRECKKCGAILAGAGWHNGDRRHAKKCNAATPEARAYYRRRGHWPRAKAALPVEVPEAPPTVGGVR